MTTGDKDIKEHLVGLAASEFEGSMISRAVNDIVERIDGGTLDVRAKRRLRTLFEVAPTPFALRDVAIRGLLESTIETAGIDAVISRHDNTADGPFTETAEALLETVSGGSTDEIMKAMLDPVTLQSARNSGEKFERYLVRRAAARLIDGGEIAKMVTSRFAEEFIPNFDDIVGRGPLVVARMCDASARLSIRTKILSVLWSMIFDGQHLMAASKPDPIGRRTFEECPIVMGAWTRSAHLENWDACPYARAQVADCRLFERLSDMLVRGTGSECTPTELPNRIVKESKTTNSVELIDASMHGATKTVAAILGKDDLVEPHRVHMSAVVCMALCIVALSREARRPSCGETQALGFMVRIIQTGERCHIEDGETESGEPSAKKSKQ